MRNTIRTIASLFFAIFLIGAMSRSAMADNVIPEYKLGPDDVIEVTVTGHEDLNQLVTVGPDGIVSLREFGDIRATGKSIAELKKLIQVEVDKNYNNAMVHIAVKERNSQQVKVVGAVLAAGPYELKPNWRVIDLVTAARGLVAKPKLVTGFIIRGEKQIPIDYEKALANPESSDNPVLEVGDMLVFNEIVAKPRKVAVEGAVLRTGTYDVDDATDPISLVAIAGNPLPQAALTKVYVQRNGVQIPMNLRPVLIEGKQDDAISKFRFMNDDLLFVPAVTDKYMVVGLVMRPGSYVIPESGTPTVLEAVQVAGGLAATANARNAEIIRTTADGKNKIIKVDLNAVIKKGNLAANQLLQGGDTLYIPERGKRGLTFQDIVNPLYMLRILGLGI